MTIARFLVGRRWARVVLIAACLAVVVGIVATARLFVWPPASIPKRADAIVVFAGGNGERLARGFELMEEDIAPTLVISNGRDPEWDDANELCDGGSRFDVICIEPDPDTTRGEARDVAELAEDRGFDSLILVTSSYHATRAGTLLDRCFNGDVGVAPAAPREGLVRTWVLAAREWVALADLVLVEREC